MSLAIALFSFITRGDPVSGLRAGETVAVLDRALAFDSETVVRSRILNANTGEPLADVMVEAWTEDTGAPQGIAQCIDRTFSKRDGTVELDCIRKNYRADKVRLSKSGFASTERALSDLFDQEVELYPAWPFEGRVIDVTGKPVVGAIVRTRETCAHAVKASQARTDSFGRFRLPDCPVGDPEIEVLGENIAPIRFQDGAHLRKLAAFYGSLDIYVAKRAPVEMRLVDALGAPMTHRRVVTHEAPMYASWTDEAGECRMFPPPESREETYWVCDTGPELTLSAVFAPTSISIVSPWEFDVGGELDARLAITFEGLAASSPPTAVFATPVGRQHLVHDAESKLPPGPGRLQLGGRFQAYAPVDLELDLEQGMNRAIVALERNHLVRVKSPEGAYEREYVQAGDDSDNLGNPTSEAKDFGYFVPSGVPVTILRDDGNGEIRRVQLPPLTADAEVDLTAPASILRPAPPAAAARTRTLRFEVRDGEGKPIAGAEGGLDAEATEIEFGPGDKGSFTWSAPAFSSYRATFLAPGCTTVHFWGSVPSRGDAPTVHVVLQRRAHLSFYGAISSVIVPGSSPESTEGSFEFDVAPGPLMVRVLRPDADPLAIELTLAEGETRRLEVR